MEKPIEPEAPAQSPPRVIVTLPDGLAIRTWQASDAPALAANATRAVWLNLRNRMPQPYTEEHAKTFISTMASPSSLVPSGPWTPSTGSTGPPIPTSHAITLHGEFIGSIGFHFGTDVYFRTAEIGYWIGEAYWGKGIMGKVVPAFMAWVWATFGVLVRVNSETYAWNEASGRVLVKAGFVFEGQREAAVVKDGRIGATRMWGALRPGGVGE